MANFLLAIFLLAGTENVQWRAFNVGPTLWHEATTQNIDPYLAAAIAWKESRFSTTAHSKTGDCGVMQVNARWSKYSCDQLKNKTIGIKAGTHALLYWKRRFAKREPHHQWLCHYNSGNKCWRRSRAYAKGVLRILKKLRRY
jgi:soluble lytic murein transglycosylase-like protein